MKESTDILVRNALRNLSTEMCGPIAEGRGVDRETVRQWQKALDRLVWDLDSPPFEL